MAKYTNCTANTVKIDDMILIEFGYDHTEHNVTEIANGYLKFRPKHGNIGNWIGQDDSHLAAVIHKLYDTEVASSNGPWESIDGTRAVKNASKKGFWRTIKQYVTN